MRCASEPPPVVLGKGSTGQKQQIREGDAVVVGVQLTSPVQAMFAVAFSYALHREFLEEVADAGSLIFATTDVKAAHEEQPLWLSVDIDGNALRQTIKIA